MSQQHIIYGIHAVYAAVQKSDQGVESIYVLSDWRRQQRLRKLVELVEQNGLNVDECNRQQLSTIAGNDNHQGVVAKLAYKEKQPAPVLEEIVAYRGKNLLLLILDGVTDPHNLGACLRTAEAAGVDAIVAPRDRAVGLTAAVRKVASGSAERVPFITVTNLARTLRQLKGEGVWLIGTEGETETSLYQQDLTGPLAIVMGGEERGLRRLTQEACDSLISIPMLGAIESLNVSVAAAVCLFEARRQRGASTSTS